MHRQHLRRQQLVHRIRTGTHRSRRPHTETPRAAPPLAILRRKAASSAAAISSSAISTRATLPWCRTRNRRSPSARNSSSASSTWRSASVVTRRPYSIRDDKQADAGLSQTRSPAACASARISALVSPASASGAATWCSAAARCPGRKSFPSSRFSPYATAAMLAPRPLRLQHRKQLVLAVEAPVRLVFRVSLVLQLMGRQHQQRNPMLLRKINRIAVMAARQRGRIRQRRQHPARPTHGALPRPDRPSPRRRNRPQSRFPAPAAAHPASFAFLPESFSGTQPAI